MLDDQPEEKNGFNDNILVSLILLSIANNKVLPVAIVYWVFKYQIKKWF